ncbi:Gar1-domain-containing protein [Aspergillus steynii IBT 23096]|uniref:H/ACA ribonucleoprotein complex subunit n=1 Tax=Aspergillus steynii IBT 23096 TaxID=1392250 RepID=A0A2I2GBN8_9EURO|nr:Gar1-domain-containing protein [Aspergillus steynii IBT 23096]PLB50257.1 Gar1-domain-containing protein [Aspergillus steynii IBT 23096]
MSFRGGGRGGFATGANRGGFASRGGRGGFQPSFGPPAQVLEMGSFMHATEGEMVCESINPKIPYFNAPIYLENKTPIGKVDEVLGPINQVYFTVKPQEGIVATSFKPGDKVYIGGDKLLPLEKFLPKPKPPPGRIANTPTPLCQIERSMLTILSRCREAQESRWCWPRWTHAWWTWRRTRCSARSWCPRGRGGFGGGGFSRGGGGGGFSRGGGGGFRGGGRGRGGFQR